MVYSKSAGRYVLKTKFEPSNDNLCHTIISEINKQLKETTPKITENETVPIPQRITP